MLSLAIFFVYTRHKEVDTMLLVLVQSPKTNFMPLVSMYVDCSQDRFIRIGYFARLGSSNAKLIGTE